MSPSSKPKRPTDRSAKTDQPAGKGRKPKATGTDRRRQARAWEADMEARTYCPQQLLDPAELLARFTDSAQELIAALPTEHQPDRAQVVGALRRAVLEAFRTREEFVARLVESDALNWTANTSALSMRRAFRAMLVDSGVRIVESCEEQALFVVVEGDGDGFEVVRPAYVDQATGKLILSGQLRRVPTPTDRPEADVLDASQGEEKA